MTKPKGTCSIPGCERDNFGRGWCQMHYYRWRRNGDPNLVRQESHNGLSLEQRFWMKVDQGTEEECWEWNASLTPAGYGKIGLNNKLLLAHRVSYEINVGPIPDGLTIDHLCRNRKCVNPSHLEPVSMEENLLRGESPPAKNALKTHCPQGHAYEGDNIIWDKGRNGKIGRKCRTCHYARTKARLAVKKDLYNANRRAKLAAQKSSTLRSASGF